MRIFDLFALIVFIVEIALKWLDNFPAYWKDGWNILDFTVTVLVRFSSLSPSLIRKSVIPEILSLFTSEKETSQLGLIASELKTLRILRTLKAVVRFGSLKIIILTVIQVMKVLFDSD